MTVWWDRYAAEWRPNYSIIREGGEGRRDDRGSCRKLWILTQNEHRSIWLLMSSRSRPEQESWKSHLKIWCYYSVKKTALLGPYRQILWFWCIMVVEWIINAIINPVSRSQYQITHLNIPFSEGINHLVNSAMILMNYWSHLLSKIVKHLLVPTSQMWIFSAFVITINWMSPL